jgi:hypothetical protein
MKKFNLQEALAGEPVISREGKQVTQLHLFEVNPSSNYSLYGVVDGHVESFTKDGKWDKDSNEGSRDLFMGPDSIYINIYKLISGDYTIGSNHNTKEEAAKAALGLEDTYVKTVEIVI